MKRILIPVDFSGNSINALQQGIKIAHSLKAKVYLVHVYYAMKRSDTLLNVNERLKQDAIKNLTELVSNMEIPGDLEIKIKAVKGDPVEAIEKYCHKIDADLIIVGTQGEMNDPEVFLGPVSGGLVKETEIPLLIIPNHHVINQIKNILFAVKSMIVKDEDQLVPLEYFVKKFKAQLQVVQVKTPDSPAEDFIVSEHIKKLKAPIDYTEAENFYDGLTNYISESDADLVCVMRRRRRFLELLFTRSLTKKHEFSSSIPMLILKGHFE